MRTYSMTAGTVPAKDGSGNEYPIGVTDVFGVRGAMTNPPTELHHHERRELRTTLGGMVRNVTPKNDPYDGKLTIELPDRGYDIDVTAGPLPPVPAPNLNL